MPKLSKKLPSYRKHRASGQAVVTLAGKDHYLGPHGTRASKAEYDRLVREHVATGGAPADKRDELTVVELLAAFYKHAREYYGPDSSEPANYSTLIKRIRTAYGKTLVAEFGPVRMKGFRQSLIDADLSRTTINQAIHRLRHIFKWGVGNELVRPDILAALKAVDGLRYGRSKAKETEPVRPAPDAYVDAVLPYCAPQVAAMIELQRVTGMRSGEVCRMRTRDINTSGSVWTYKPTKHKSTFRGHQRIIYLGPKAQAIVREWLRADLEAPLFQPREVQQWRIEQRHGQRKTPLSCGNRPGTNRKSKPRRKPGVAYDANTYGSAVKYAIRKCNEDRESNGEPPIHWHPHQLRHNYATMARREYGLEIARVLLGHKHAAITEIYAEADQERAVEVVAKIG